MLSKNKLLFLSGNQIPFVSGRLIIHPPKLREIAYIGQDNFYLGINFLCFSKDNLQEKDKNNLINKTNFDILMSMINQSKKNTTNNNLLPTLESIFMLILPNYELMYMPNMIVFNRQFQDGTKEQGMITQDNYEQFKSIIKEMFCLSNLGGQDYNPANKLAEQIANKLRQRHKKLEKKQADGQKKSISILSRYVSILTIANHHTIPELMQYTIYQLFDQFHRFEKKFAYDTWFSAKLAGAQNLDDVDNWLSDEEDKIQSKPQSNRIEYK